MRSLALCLFFLSVRYSFVCVLLFVVAFCCHVFCRVDPTVRPIAGEIYRILDLAVAYQPLGEYIYNLYKIAKIVLASLFSLFLSLALALRYILRVWFSLVPVLDMYPLLVVGHL